MSGRGDAATFVPLCTPSSPRGSTRQRTRHRTRSPTSLVCPGLSTSQLRADTRPAAAGAAGRRIIAAVTMPPDATASSSAPKLPAPSGTCPTASTAAVSVRLVRVEGHLVVPQHLLIRPNVALGDEERHAREHVEQSPRNGLPHAGGAHGEGGSEGDMTEHKQMQLRLPAERSARIGAERTLSPAGLPTAVSSGRKIICRKGNGITQRFVSLESRLSCQRQRHAMHGLHRSARSSQETRFRSVTSAFARCVDTLFASAP